MKTKLLLALSFFTFLCKAQAPINSYYSVDGSTFTVVNSVLPLDDTPTGANATWDFTSLNQIGTSTETNLAPTSQESTTFPNTTTNTLTTTEINFLISESNIYSKNNAGEVSITGIVNSEIELNFVDDNALLGTFPLNYGYSNSDTVAGTFISGAFNGDVAGTVNTSVDAYGTLNLNIDSAGETSYAVTRLKSVQNITLHHFVFGNVGTIAQTVYYYYINGGPNSAIFKTSRTIVNVPLQGINNETTDRMEKYNIPLGVVSNIAVADQLTLFPNPTNDVLNIDNKTMQAIKQITITDMSGRMVMRNNGNVNLISIGHLKKGIYTATLETETNKVTQKIIKK
ncbi:T9SS type A sorting domain-containing protein [Flavobacterium sp.]|uniref:T9SS type A sorting domain-containing protein n=1 Tax=Flavobacterium sp. TaxID=239 RepID=UPI00286BF2C7|nr:T9SS type A sorting domain-containing protein [Flavobacterium sp.]